MAELLEKAKVYEGGENVVGWFASPKLDGIRAFWDGGITRRRAESPAGFEFAVPWADGGQVPKSTGLWSQYGHVIHAPEWWLDRLPPIPLDGELWTGRKQFQRISSVVRRHEPGPEWKDIRYVVFDSPPWGDFLTPRRIKNLHAEIIMDRANYSVGVVQAAHQAKSPHAGAPYRDRFDFLVDEVETNTTLTLVSNQQVGDNALVERWLKDELELGGEGIMLHDYRATWKPTRHAGILKVKPSYDAEGVVADYQDGKGKHEGRMGALWVNFQGKRFKIGTGFTDQEREEAKLRFPIGSRVTFTYRELSDGGVPKEARFTRKAVPA